ncbi:Unconventional myosin-If, partial [Dissostichus eleginoides]
MNTFPVTAGLGPGAPSMGSARYRSLPPSLPPSSSTAGVHSSPVLSIHTQGAAGERAPPTPERNVPKFWNLKPWRGYLTFGSLEP